MVALVAFGSSGGGGCCFVLFHVYISLESVYVSVCVDDALRVGEGRNDVVSLSTSE